MNSVKNEELRKAYMEANQDEGQQEAMDEWESTIGDAVEEAIKIVFGLN